MAEVETRIYMAMKTRLEGVTSLSIAWPASGYEPANEQYVAVSEVTFAPVQILIDRSKPYDRRGAWSIKLVTPLGPPVERIKEQAALLAKAFETPDRLEFQGVCVKVNGPRHIQDGYRSDGYWHQPITFNWRCFA